MNRYGCWDCGAEMTPVDGRCVVCGWPAAPARKRRPGLWMGLGVFAVVAIVATQWLHAAPERRHRWNDSRCGPGNPAVCQDCGKKAGVKWTSLAGECPKRK